MKINILLCSIIFVILLVVFFVDNNSLNSLVIDYNDKFVINEVSTVEDKDDSSKDNGKTVLVNNTVVDKWVFPVSGNYAITTYYSYGHKAIDIYSYNGYGSNIMSANNGVVISANSNCYRGNISCNGNRGNYVIIKHNNDNYYTVYMHLADIYVKNGEVVNSGQIIGTMGNTGQVIPVPSDSNPYAGTHLHFCVFIGEPYRGGYAINPFNLY